MDEQIEMSNVCDLHPFIGHISFIDSLISIPKKYFYLKVEIPLHYTGCFDTEGHSFKTLRFFLVIRLCSHHMTFMLMTWKISSIFSTVIARIVSSHNIICTVLPVHLDEELTY